MDSTIVYKIIIERSQSLEELSMALFGSNSYDVASDSKLVSTGSSPGEILKTKTLQIFSRNK